MAQRPAVKDGLGDSSESEWMRKVPEEVVGVGRFDDTWMFRIGYGESTLPSSVLMRDGLVNHVALAGAKSVHIVWKEQWKYDIPEDLERDGILELTRTLDAMIDANEDVVWLAESSSYSVGDNRTNHICMERACLDSRGTRCPGLAGRKISEKIADRVSADDRGRREKFDDAIKHLGKVVLDTHNRYPNDPSQMTAAMVALASSDIRFQGLMPA